MKLKLSIVEMVESQVIASIKGEDSIDEAIKSNCNIIFLLTGNLLNIRGYVSRLQEAGKYVFIHLDFIDGIGYDKSAIEFISKEVQPEGIITTKSHLIKVAKEYGLITIQRTFLIDESAVKKGIELIKSCKPDAVEVMPGIMPRVIYEITEQTELPVIAGGLIRFEDEILESLKAGALATSIGDSKFWNLGI